MMLVNVSGWGRKCFGLSCEDAQDKDDWRSTWQPANLGLSGKWSLKWCVVAF